MRKKNLFCFSDLIRHILAAWLLAVTVEFLLLPGNLRTLNTLDGLSQMSFLRVLILTLCGTGLLTAAAFRRDIVIPERWSVAALFGTVSGLALFGSFTGPFLAVCSLILTGLLVFAIRGWRGSVEPAKPDTRTRTVYLWITAGFTAVFFLFVSVWTVGRIYSFSTPSYDFGIFSQMFYNMRQSGQPLTTIERDGLLSHFHVHMSPIYYLMLPFYYLAPAPATLQILQAAVLASAVIPLWKIGKLHGLRDWQRMLLCAVLLLFPAYAGGAGYDIHENCFLTPLILWLFYGIDKQNLWVTVFSAALTLTVKEDAAVYVAVIALWLTIRSILYHNRKMGLTGICILAGSLIWFLLVTGFLANTGDGVMTYRYNNFIYDGSASLLTVVKAVIMNPMKALFECVDAEKLKFIALTLIPLLGLPLLTRRYERYILLIPYILVNLMSDYPYQHDIFFQYTFGSTACLLYLTAVNLADIRQEKLRSVTLTAVVLTCLIGFCSVIVPVAVRYPVQCVQQRHDYRAIREVLSQIPEEVSVAASTFYTTTLSQRETLYDIHHCSRAHLLSCDYIIVSQTDDMFQELCQLLPEHGYEPAAFLDGVLTVFRKTSP